MATYLNPVFNKPFADPFVLKFGNEYWGYGTGVGKDGRRFGIIRSNDLVNWEEVGGALDPLPDNGPYYWAPEAIYREGRFYLYYSVGDEVNMELRVAVAEHPAGPFVDSGKRLTQEQFAIDAHVFVDDNGAEYLFYATDFLEHSHIGTGTVVDRLLDPFTLEGKPYPVTRARYDWQVYDPQRAEKGGVRWHTLEGPFVLKHKGLYYQMFSGGNWHNLTYGVSYGVTRDINTPDEWEQVADGLKTLPIIRTIPGKVIGPGHNSVVLGPDNRQLYAVYHRWSDDGSARLLAIDPLDWCGERLIALGPSTTPRPLPNRATVTGFGEGWQFVGGEWRNQNGVLAQPSNSFSTATFHPRVSSFLAEVNLRQLPGASEKGSYGVMLQGGDQELFRFSLLPALNEAVITWQDSAGQYNKFLKLPESFVPAAFHLLKVEADGAYLRVELSHPRLNWEDKIAVPIDTLTLFGENCPAAFSGFALTEGWEELFTGPEMDQWQVAGNWQVRNGEWHSEAGPEEAVAARGPLLEDYELVVNARLISGEGGYGIYPAAWQERGPLLRLSRQEDRWFLVLNDQNEIIPLPATFDPFIYQQFRFRKQQGKIAVAWADLPLGIIDAPTGPTGVALHNRDAHVAFDMVRITTLP